MNRNLVNVARQLRKRTTNAENVLWKYLRNKQIIDVKFRRQQIIDNYIVDFVSFEKRIVIELDGSQHSLKGNKDKDLKRDTYLTNNGFKVLRFWDNDVLKNIEGVFEVILENCLSPSPNPSRQGRG